MTITLTAAIELFFAALLTFLSKFLISFANAKIAEIKARTKDETQKKYLDMVDKTITECVIATNQTYVDALKGKDLFNAEAQKIAFDMTFEAVKTLLSQEAINYLTEMSGDADKYLTTLIEASVNKNKGSK